MSDDPPSAARQPGETPARVMRRAVLLIYDMADEFGDHVEWRRLADEMAGALNSAAADLESEA